MKPTFSQPLAIIDESGALPDPQEKYVAVAVLVVEKGEEHRLKRILKRTRQRLPRKGKRRREWRKAELKFGEVGDKTIRMILQALAEQKVEIYLLVVEKTERPIPDTPQNYAEIVWYILQEAMTHYPDLEVLIDKHFTQKQKRERFNQLIEAYAGRKVDIKHVDSQQDSRVNLADFVAGATRYKALGRPEFFSLFQRRVVLEKKMKWK